MRNFILADNQELTRFALENLLQQDETAVVYRAFDKAGLVALLKEHESAIVILDYTLFDFTDEDQLLIVAERFALSQWVLLSEELTSRFLRRVVYSSHQFSVVFKDAPCKRSVRLCNRLVVITDISASVRWRLLSVSSRRRTSNPVCSQIQRQRL